MASTSQSPSASSSSTPTANTNPQTDNAVFLSFPSPPPADEAESNPSHKVAAQEKKKLLKDRLYVGNLHPTVDEYTLLTLFGKYGTITSLDYLFHKTGPSRGKPRGFAFVEFAEQASAQRALSAHDKLLRGRKLVVTYAHQAPIDDTSQQGGVTRYRKGMMDSGKPTTLSLIKSGRGDGPNPKDKIALMEAKLQQMEASSAHVPPASASTSAHPSLPQKPPAQSVSQPLPQPSRNQSSNSRPQAKIKPRQPLPSLPILPQSRQNIKSTTDFGSSLSQSYSLPPSSVVSTNTSGAAMTTTEAPKNTPTGKRQQLPGRGSGLAGVKIVRKDR